MGLTAIESPEHQGPMGHRVANAAGWVAGSRLVVRFLDLASTIVLARLLAPEEFGLVAMAMSVYLLAEVLSQFGVGLALISQQDADRSHYDTAWTLSILRGFVIGFTTVIIAEPASRFYDDPRLPLILFILAGLAAIDGFRNIAIFDFVKDLKFHKEFILIGVEKLATVLVAITFAVISQSYWAIMAGFVAGKIAGIVASYALTAFRPRLSLRRWRSMLGFGVWTLTSAISGFIGHRAPTFFLGRMIDAQAVGIFNIAYQVSNLATTELLAPIQRALFPGYSKIVNDPHRLRRAFLRAVAVLFTVGSPAAVGIGMVAEPLVLTLLGERWRESIPIVQVMAAFAFLQIPASPTGGVYLAMKKPQILSGLVGASALATLPALYAGVQLYGTLGAALAMIGVAVLYVLTDLTIIGRLLQVRLPVLALAIWRPLAATLVMIIVVSASDQTLGETYASIAPPYLLMLLIALGAGAYIVALLLLWRAAGRPDGAERILIDHAAEMAQRSKVAFCGLLNSQVR